MSRVARYAGAVALGTLASAVVLVTMQQLVAAPTAELDESASRRFIDFVRVERDETTERQDRRREKPPAPPAPPPVPSEPRVDTVDPVPIAVEVPRASLAFEMSIDGLGFAASDGDYLPIVKIAPTYPMNARIRGIEGYCIVAYTVTETGSVTDVSVVEAEPRNVFDAVSIEAAEKFKYRPRVVDGTPIAVRGVRNLFRYELES